MTKKIIYSLLLVFGISQFSSAQFGFSHEVGAFVGPTLFYSDYGQSDNTKTNLTNNVKHPGKYDKTTVGMCGVKKEWIAVIPELTEENIDSLYAGYLVLDHLIKEKGSKVKGLAAYKGSIKNYKPVNFTLKVEKELN